jgi:hypothetical protein
MTMTDKERIEELSKLSAESMNKISRLERQLERSFDFIKAVLASDNYCPHYFDMDSVPEEECELKVPCDTCIITAIKEIK